MTVNFTVLLNRYYSVKQARKIDCHGRLVCSGRKTLVWGFAVSGEKVWDTLKLTQSCQRETHRSAY